MPRSIISALPPAARLPAQRIRQRACERVERWHRGVHRIGRQLARAVPRAPSPRDPRPLCDRSCGVARHPMTDRCAGSARPVPTHERRRRSRRPHPRPAPPDPPILAVAYHHARIGRRFGGQLLRSSAREHTRQPSRQIEPLALAERAQDVTAARRTRAAETSALPFRPASASARSGPARCAAARLIDRIARIKSARPWLALRPAARSPSPAASTSSLSVVVSSPKSASSPPIMKTNSARTCRCSAAMPSASR